MATTTYKTPRRPSASAPERRRYSCFGVRVNDPEAVQRVKDFLPVPETCRYCGGSVRLVSNASFYGGRVYGWPLAYCCDGCGARVGCHSGTDIPLGTLADEKTMLARRKAHAAFDPIWKDKGPKARSKAYRMLAQKMGLSAAHISWMDVEQCEQVIQISRLLDIQKPA